MDVDDVTQIELDNSRAVEGVICRCCADGRSYSPVAHQRGGHRLSQYLIPVADVQLPQTVGEDKAMGKTAIVS